MMGVTRDITDQKKAEKRLKESEGQYRTLVENSPLPISVVRDGKYVYLNPAGLRAYQANNPEDIVGKSIFDFVIPEDCDLVANALKELQEHPQTPLRKWSMYALSRAK